MKTTILIADDHKILREGLRSLIEKDKTYRVVGESADGREMLDKARELEPDIIIMDITMPGMNGIEATGRLKSEYPAMKVIGLSMHSDRQYVINMLKADRHSPMREFREMISDHTIIPFENTTKLGQLKDVLYQIRCNIFHGEKVPGDLNDDRIVAAAVPVLSQLLDALVDREVRD